MSESDLALAIEQYHRAQGALLIGDPEPLKRMWSRRDDATLANPLGPPVRGRSEIEETLDSVASAMRGGEAQGFERITEYAHVLSSPLASRRVASPSQ